MSKPSTNPFFEADFSKFMDMSKMMGMGEFKMPGVNMDAVMASHRKNMEAFTQVSQAAFESAQVLARRQADWMRQGFEETTNLINSVMSAETPEEKVIRQAECSKAAMEKCIANVREVAETVARTNAQAMETVSNRLSESMDEFRDIVHNVRAA